LIHLSLNFIPKNKKPMAGVHHHLCLIGKPGGPVQHTRWEKNTKDKKNYVRNKLTRNTGTPTGTTADEGVTATK
jgi:hypothetical protein